MAQALSLQGRARKCGAATPLGDGHTVTESGPGLPQGAQVRGEHCVNTHGKPEARMSGEGWGGMRSGWRRAGWCRVTRTGHKDTLSCKRVRCRGVPRGAWCENSTAHTAGGHGRDGVPPKPPRCSVKEGATKEVLGILVSYRVKVKLVVSRGG